MTPSAFRKQLGAAIKEARETRGMTQRELAGYAGIAEKYLSRIELGHVTPSVLVAHRLAEGCRTTLDALVTPRTKPAKLPPQTVALLKLVRGRSPRQLDLVLRVVGELLR
jgi:transcriptional regulator with XRE-family HTH domain